MKRMNFSEISIFQIGLNFFGSFVWLLNRKITNTDSIPLLDMMYDDEKGHDTYTDVDGNQMIDGGDRKD